MYGALRVYPIIATSKKMTPVVQLCNAVAENPRNFARPVPFNSNVKHQQGVLGPIYIYIRPYGGVEKIPAVYSRRIRSGYVSRITLKNGGWPVETEIGVAANSFVPPPADEIRFPIRETFRVCIG